MCRAPTQKGPQIIVTTVLGHAKKTRTVVLVGKITKKEAEKAGNAEKEFLLNLDVHRSYSIRNIISNTFITYDSIILYIYIYNASFSEKKHKIIRILAPSSCFFNQNGGVSPFFAVVFCGIEPTENSTDHRGWVDLRKLDLLQFKRTKVQGSGRFGQVTKEIRTNSGGEKWMYKQPAYIIIDNIPIGSMGWEYVPSHFPLVILAIFHRSCR